MLARRRLLCTLIKRMTSPPRTPCEPVLIEYERERLFGKIARLRQQCGAPTQFIDKAEVLLTRLWAMADWRTRGQLTKTANWLVRLECARINLANDSAPRQTVAHRCINGESIGNYAGIGLGVPDRAYSGIRGSTLTDTVRISGAAVTEPAEIGRMTDGHMFDNPS
jgi:hypothetical protein